MGQNQCSRRRFDLPMVRPCLIAAFALAFTSPYTLVATSPAGNTEQVSVDTQGAGGNASSRDPDVSADGRFVVFLSQASNLSSGDNGNGFGVFLRDREQRTTERINLDSQGHSIDGTTSTAVVSDDGRYVAFDSLWADAASHDTNGVGDVFVRDREAGTTERISIDREGNHGSYRPAISGNGRFVAYISYVVDTPDPNGTLDILVYDRNTRETFFANVTTGGEIIRSYFDPDLGVALNQDGTVIAFTFGAALAPALPWGPHVYVHDRSTGVTEVASVSSEGEPATGGHFDRPVLSATGRFVGFSSGASLVPGDTNVDARRVRARPPAFDDRKSVDHE